MQGFYVLLFHLHLVFPPLFFSTYHPLAIKESRRGFLVDCVTFREIKQRQKRLGSLFLLPM